MKKIISLSLIASMLFPVKLLAQKDELRLACPFEHGSGREPKEPFTWQPRDEKVIMISHTDTIVRSCINGTVSNVNQTEDGNYEIVIYYKNFYFWYYGVANPLVKKGDNVTARQPVASYKTGTELEFRMFKDEKPMDPRNLLECKILRADD